MDTHMEEIRNDEERQIGRVRPGYSEQVSEGQVFMIPTVFASSPGLSLAMMRKPDLRQAVEMPGGVSIYYYYYI